jgi:predicted TIM-barrel fold metal-dependent hydrolase
LEDVDGVDVGRCLFGSDWCFASLDEALEGWKTGPVDEERRRLILHDNAVRLLDTANR